MTFVQSELTAIVMSAMSNYVTSFIIFFAQILVKIKMTIDG